jgi:hypothetical protein
MPSKTAGNAAANVFRRQGFGPIGADAGHVCLPKGALLVNIGRDSTVDEMAAAEALQTEHLDGYAADVFAMEDLTCPPEMFPIFGRVCFSRGRTNETQQVQR